MIETNERTTVTVQGRLTVTINLKDSKRRFNPPDIKSDIEVQCSGSVEDIETLVSAELERAKYAIFVSTGRRAVIQ